MAQALTLTLRAFGFLTIRFLGPWHWLGRYRAESEQTYSSVAEISLDVFHVHLLGRTSNICVLLWGEISSFTRP